MKDIEKLDNFINNEFVAPKDNEYLENMNPGTGDLLNDVAVSTEEDALKAVDAADAAFQSWSKTTIEERASYLRKISQAIYEQRDELALAETQDNGKPLVVSKAVDIPRAQENFNFFADAITQSKSEFFQQDQQTIHYTHRRPLGAVTCISPWNLPLYLLSWKIAPAIAAGNTVVAKPSEVTPYTAFLLSKILKKVDLPKGVVNILHGPGAPISKVLTEHEKIKAVSFTGSTATGKIIATQAAPHFKKLSLEMGGKNPTIVFKDADLKKAVSGAVRAGFSNQGQICLCGSRIYIHEDIYEDFKKLFVEKVSRLRVGDPLDEKTRIGAVVSRDHMKKIISYIKLATEEGGTLLTGGAHLRMAGNYISPAVFENLPQNCRVNQEEIFGPVVTLNSFKTEEEAIALANDTNYGLSANIWTEKIGQAHRVAQNLQVGMVWINNWLVRDLRTHFGGSKLSGMGREGGNSSLQFYTESNNITVSF